MGRNDQRKGFIRKGLMLALSFLLVMVAFLPAGSAQAADSKWINAVWTKYKNYNSTVNASYNTYMTKLIKDYNTYYKSQNDRLAELERIVLEDQKKWNEKLAADLAELKPRYESNDDLRAELRQYEREINPNSLSSQMGVYVRAANRHSLSSTMGLFARELNENSLSSYMYEYKKATNINSLSSPAYGLHKTVTDTYLSSPMYALMKSSSTSYISSPIYAYSRGRISKANAQKQYAKLFTQYTEQISQDSATYKQQIASTSQSVQQKVEALYQDTIRQLENQRNNTLQAISDQRKKLTGEGLTWEPLLLAPVEGSTGTSAGSQAGNSTNPSAEKAPAASQGTTAQQP
ncbi:hypothetical protein J25TS5_43240 [Paenibacillus faecis]|uniref:hypothetical protein n=1 Tax=Paenibacillus faecis TaxID=862114 RepID=UPI001B2D3C27|nr:hypothetical protein [Paenibacillus faecis]GIO87392.1 hypothetical protein J25TS5_43240 [Paenibacillus faecis]